MKDQPSPESIAFQKKFYPNKLDREEIVHFKASEAIGFSLKRQYPSDCGFVPVRNPAGDDDSFILVRFWYYPSQAVNNVAKFYSSVSKSSNFEQKRWFQGGAPDAERPTDEAKRISDNSFQPVDLSNENDFEINLKDQKIIDRRNNKKTNISEIADEMVNAHLKPTRLLAGFLIRTKLSLKDRLAKILTPIIDWLIKKALLFINRRVGGGLENEFGLKPIKLSDLETIGQKKISILGYEFEVAEKPLAILFCGLTILYIFKFWHWQIELPIISSIALAINGMSNAIVGFLEAYSTSPIFIFTTSVTLLFVFSSVVPWSVIILINLLIRIRTWLWKLRFEIDGRRSWWEKIFS